MKHELLKVSLQIQGVLADLQDVVEHLQDLPKIKPHHIQGDGSLTECCLNNKVIMNCICKTHCLQGGLQGLHPLHV